MFLLDLAPFERYLAQRKLADERQRPHLLRWVRRYLQGTGARTDLNPSDRMEVFANEIQADSRLADWQKQQALQAVHLYVNSFLPAVSHAKAAPDYETPLASPSPQKPPAHGSPLEKMRELLRLRHYSYRTEQSYLDWVKRCLDYSGNQHLDCRQADSLQCYLSFLALQKRVAASNQNQAFNALLFLFREVFQVEPGHRLSGSDLKY
jgi:hypothetical protein